MMSPKYSATAFLTSPNLWELHISRPITLNLYVLAPTTLSGNNFFFLFLLFRLLRESVQPMTRCRHYMFLVFVYLQQPSYFGRMYLGQMDNKNTLVRTSHPVKISSIRRQDYRYTLRYVIQTTLLLLPLVYNATPKF